MQIQQKVWPQFVSTASLGVSKQIGHSPTFECTYSGVKQILQIWRNYISLVGHSPGLLGFPTKLLLGVISNMVQNRDKLEENWQLKLKMYYILGAVHTWHPQWVREVPKRQTIVLLSCTGATVARGKVSKKSKYHADFFCEWSPTALDHHGHICASCFANCFCIASACILSDMEEKFAEKYTFHISVRSGSTKMKHWIS